MNAAAYSNLKEKGKYMTNTNTGMFSGLPRALDTVLWGGLIAGILDSVDAVIAFGLKGMNPTQVLQYIASGLLGTAAFQGGLATAALGALLHFFIAFAVSTVFYVASLKLPALYRQAAIWGLVYGAAVYLFMNYLVLPLSAVPKTPFSLALFLNGVIGHALFVGFPIAWFARRSARTT
jgi:uncharacterized membrane protein YagU involved in acid resistance